MIWIMFKIKFFHRICRTYLLYIYAFITMYVHVYYPEESQQFPQKYAGKLINSVEKPVFFHSFYTQVRYIRQKKSSVDFYSVFPFLEHLKLHTHVTSTFCFVVETFSNGTIKI